MIDEKTPLLSGSLFFPSKRAEFWDTIKLRQNFIENLENLRPGWISFKIFPNVNWVPNEYNVETVPSYSFWVRNGGDGRVMLLSTRRELVTRLLREIGLEDWIDNTPAVDIAGLMNDLMESPRKTVYTLGAIISRVTGFRGALRTMIMYGNDIADATIFQNSIVNWIEPYRLTLRYSKSHEVLSISEYGDVSFYYRGHSTLTEVDDAIRTIGSQLQRLDWKVESND